MKATKGINAIDFNGLAKLTKDSKSAGIIALLAIEASDSGQVALTNKSIVEATGMDRKNVSVALSHLREKRILLKDPVCDNIHHINSRLLRVHDPRSLNDADYFPEFSAKIERFNFDVKPSRQAIRAVNRMNKLTDADIAEHFGNNAAPSKKDSSRCPQIENVPNRGQ